MALDLDCQTTEYYIGDGRQQIFTYAFEIIEEKDLHVAFYNTDTREYDEVPSIDNWSKPMFHKLGLSENLKLDKSLLFIG